MRTNVHNNHKKNSSKKKQSSMMAILLCTRYVLCFMHINIKGERQWPIFFNVQHVNFEKPSCVLRKQNKTIRQAYKRKMRFRCAFLRRVLVESLCVFMFFLVYFQVKIFENVWLITLLRQRLNHYLVLSFFPARQVFEKIFNESSKTLKMLKLSDSKKIQQNIS
jgi:hypothetical protein